MIITTIKPYSDDKLFWNETTGRYELSFEYVKSNFDINFKNDAELKKRLSQNSRLIYNFILYNCNTRNKAVVEWALNKTPKGREFLFDVLLEQFDADNDSGYNDLVKISPINVSNGQVIDRGLILQNLVSVNTQIVIDRNAEYFGFNILYAGQLPTILYKVATSGDNL